MWNARLVDAIRHHDVITINTILQQHRFNSFRRSTVDEVLNIISSHSPTPHPDLIIHVLVRGGMETSQLLKHACINGNLLLVTHVVTHYSDIPIPSLNNGLSHAARCNHPHIIEWMLNNTPVDPMFGLNMAASQGYVEIIDLILGISRHHPWMDLGSTMHHAVYYNQLHVVQRLIEYGYTDFPAITYISAKQGHNDILLWLLCHHPCEIQDVLYGAVESLCVRTMYIVLDHGAHIDYKSIKLLTSYRAGCQIGVDLLLLPLCSQKLADCTMTYTQLVDMIIEAINLFEDVTAAIRLILHRVSCIGQFHVPFSPDDIRLLTLDGITIFPGYDEVATRINQRLYEEMRSLEQHVPTVLAHLVIMYA